MKKYVEPKMESISFLISDVIAASKPVYGTETGNEFEHNKDNGNEETFLNDMTTDINDGDW